MIDASDHLRKRSARLKSLTPEQQAEVLDILHDSE